MCLAENRLNVIPIPGYSATSAPLSTLPLAITTPTPAPGTLLGARLTENPRTDSVTWKETKQVRQLVTKPQKLVCVVHWSTNTKSYLER
jgi:hypothetical protein